MRVLVTGGAGYVGTELVRALARRSDIEELVVYDNLSRSNRDLFLLPGLAEKSSVQRIRFVQGDVLDSRTLGVVLKGIDVVYHLAGKVRTPFANEDFHGFDQVNHWGTAELSYLLEQHPVRRLVYLSSTAVYGATGKGATATSRAAPETTYGLSKYQGERMLERLGERLTLIVFRCGNVYGYSPSMRFDAVINRFMFDAHFGGRITVHGSGKQNRAFVHVESAVRALSAALVDLPAGVYNLVERNLSILDVASHVQELYPELEVLFIQQDVALRDLRVERDSRLENVLKHPLLADQLRALRDRFAF